MLASLEPYLEGRRLSFECQSQEIVPVDSLQSHATNSYTNSTLEFGRELEEIMNGPAFASITTFLDRVELLQSVPLVCSTWTDAASEALSSLMLTSIGYDLSLKPFKNDIASVEADETYPVDESYFKSSSVSKSMEKDWLYIQNSFPTGKFLSKGALKKVYQVWNKHHGAYEAISVM